MTTDWVNFIIALKGKADLLVFERARAPRHFLLGKGLLGIQLYDRTFTVTAST